MFERSINEPETLTYIIYRDTQEIHVSSSARNDVVVGVLIAEVAEKVYTRTR